ncbi:MAG: Rne/Rng family ribonuclease [Oligosphaeraceae bacterium]|nr:Rne/Rng family ribonuclease [Oligosphaeraceae bacterium]
MKQILINSEELQTRVAVVEDGVLRDFFMERTNRDRLVGSIYKARIKNLEPSLQAAFVDIGCGKNAFLHYWDMIPASQEMLEGSDNDDNGGDTAGKNSAPANSGVQLLPLTSEPPPPRPKQQRQRHHRPHAQQQQPQQQLVQGQEQPVADLPEPAQPEVASGTAVMPQPKSSFLRRLAKIFPVFAKGEQQSDAVAPSPAAEVPPPVSAPMGAPAAVPAAKQPTLKESVRSAMPRRKRPPVMQQKSSPTVDDIPELFKVDQEILVQVTKGPIGTKGARVTTNLSIPGRYLVLLPNSNHIGISRRVEEREERDRLRKMIKSLSLPNNMGLICRTVGAGLKIEHFQRDLDMLLDCWNKAEDAEEKHRAPYCVYQEPDLAERTLRDCLTEDIDEVVADSEEAFKCASALLLRYNRQSKVKVKFYQNPTSIFSKYGVSQQIDNIFNRKVNLPSGGYICIDETEALIAIDVNSGKNRSGKDHPETILATNLEAVKEIARQLRLRNIGGLVVLDLIDMRSKKDQQTVYKTFRELVAEDRARIKTTPISSLGLLEMTRQRENESLESTIYDDCPYCKGRGLVKSATSMSVEIQRRLNEVLARKQYLRRLAVHVNSKVMDRLRIDDRKVMDSLAVEFERQITFRSDPNMHIEEFKIIDLDSNKEI